MENSEHFSIINNESKSNITDKWCIDDMPKTSCQNVNPIFWKPGWPNLKTSSFPTQPASNFSRKNSKKNLITCQNNEPQRKVLVAWINPSKVPKIACRARIAQNLHFLIHSLSHHCRCIKFYLSQNLSKATSSLVLEIHSESSNREFPASTSKMRIPRHRIYRILDSLDVR